MASSNTTHHEAMRTAYEAIDAAEKALTQLVIDKNLDFYSDEVHGLFGELQMARSNVYRSLRRGTKAAA